MPYNPKLPPTFDELHELAWLSADLRIQRSLGMEPPSTDFTAWWTHRNLHPFVALNDAIITRMAILGRRCRGSGADMRNSPFWDLMEHKWAYLRAYESMRPVTLQKVSPELLDEHLVQLHNIIRWNGWTVRVTARRLIDDDYGMPMFARGCKLWGPGGKRFTIDPSPDNPSHLVYALMTGAPAPDWPGELASTRHPAEMSW